MIYDLVVIGGGPSGVTAALRASELGASVALVERNFLGGAGMNDGCVPVRVLAKAARAVRDAGQFAAYGLEAPLPTVNFATLLERAQQVVYQLHEKKQLLNHLSNMNVDVYENVGDASFISPEVIQFGDGRQITGDKFILCVGGHSRRLEFPGSEHALTYNDVWSMDSLPESVIIVGGGAIGCQLASVFDTFGSKVTLINTGARLLGVEDEAIADAILKQFRQRDIEVILNVKGIHQIERYDDQLELIYTHDGRGESRMAETVITAVGWPGNLDKLNLEAAGVKKNGAYIEVDDRLQTTAPNIYAAGDITGKIMLVQTASHQARYAVENALLGRSAHDLESSIPHGGFTDPEYAGIGLTEEQARNTTEYAVATVPYADMDRAVIDDHIPGFFKLLVDVHTHKIIGAHAVGEQAVEVIQIVAAAMGANMPVERLANVNFAYPTFGSIVGVAARQIAVELKWIPVESQWYGLSRSRVSEWERTAGGTQTGIFALVRDEMLLHGEGF
ncbi:MAG: NAD(P)/FAD-dependent oxidoreductase [Chloroflexi bacterium]|nr:NAD(P)/FAD-dependent oxidoreductase [Chloroflexota bacterium]MCC6891349.1 NAD(P)/FAD-dependent oxidoreductase [Anaerolineae bacterium]